MRITALKTHKIKTGEDLFKVLETYLTKLEEESIVVITSKIISICQGNVVRNDGTVDKIDLIKKEADYYFEDDTLTQYGVVIPTIKKSILIANAGVDESNADGNYILWPQNPDNTAEEIWNYLRRKYAVKKLGVVITDSHLMPMRWGVHAVGISWCGFVPLKDYRNTPDIFGKPMRMEQENIVDELANAAGVVMGEGNEQTPLAVITELPFVQFQTRVPNKEERQDMLIDKKDDIYNKLLTSVKWIKGGKNEQ